MCPRCLKKAAAILTICLLARLLVHLLLNSLLSRWRLTPPPVCHDRKWHGEVREPRQTSQKQQEVFLLCLKMRGWQEAMRPPLIGAVLSGSRMWLDRDCGRGSAGVCCLHTTALCCCSSHCPTRRRHDDTGFHQSLREKDTSDLRSVCLIKALTDT